MNAPRKRGDGEKMHSVLSSDTLNHNSNPKSTISSIGTPNNTAGGNVRENMELLAQ